MTVKTAMIQANEQPSRRASVSRVFLVTNVPTPYRLPLFNEISRQFEELGLKLTVIFSALGYARREWSIEWDSAAFDYEILHGRPVRLGSFEKYMFTYPGFIKRIQRERPLLAITAGSSIATMMLRLCRLVPFVIWSEEVKSQSLARALYRRWLIRGASAFIACGSASKRYLESLGARPDRIAIAVNTVDTEFFAAQFQRRVDYVKSRSKHMLLSVSVLTARKQIGTLLYAAKRLAGRRSDCELLIVGSGPERENLENLARDLEVTHVVKFVGFLQRQQLADVFGRTSVFLFPSRHDIWGMVLVEAMAAGVPSIASIYAGATEDLIEDGVTGYAVDFANTEAVCERIERLLDDPELARNIGLAAYSRIKAKASLAASAEGFVQAAKTILCPG